MRFHTTILGATMAVLFSSTVQGQGFFGSKGTGAEVDSRAVKAQASAFADKQEEWLKPFALALYRDGEWGAVLNLERLGLAAMEKQRFALARKAFDESIARVESIYADDANASKARSVFNQEKVKDFKGEPYERAMLYYYRGLLYAQDGDYQNARASFLAADRHDTLSSSEDQAYVGNFGMMKYLAAWASHCDGDKDRGEQLAGEARAIDSKIQAIPPNPANSLILVDTAAGPQKWGDGKYKEILKFKGGDGQAPAFTLTKGGLPVGAPQWVIGDVNFQATTRGGREIDGIMSGKAKFKDSAGAIGDTALQVGQQAAMVGALSGNRDMANAGLIGMFAGLIAKGVEQATTPAADLRGWEALPGKVVMISAPDIAKGAPLELKVAGAGQPLPLVSAHGSCSIAWGRTASALASGQGGAGKADESAPTEANRGDRNRSFRAMLVDELLSSQLVAAK